MDGTPHAQLSFGAKHALAPKHIGGEQARTAQEPPAADRSRVKTCWMKLNAISTCHYEFPAQAGRTGRKTHLIYAQFCHQMTCHSLKRLPRMRLTVTNAGESLFHGSFNELGHGLVYRDGAARRALINQAVIFVV